MKVLRLDFWREISKSKNRFFSISLLIMIGTILFIGLKSVGPNMTDTASDYYKKYQLLDFQIQTTVGFEEADYLNLMKADPTIESSELGYSQIVMSYEKNLVAYLKSFPKYQKNEDSGLEIIEGKLPRKSGELAIDKKMLGSYKIGDKITFNDSSDTAIKDQLKVTTFKIVGIVSSPEFIQSGTRGLSPVGKGLIDFFGVILEEDFALPVYSTISLRYQNTKNLNGYSQKYSDEIDKKTKVLESWLDELVLNKQTKAKEDLQKSVKSLEKEVISLKDEIKNGTEKLEENEKLLNEKKAEYDKNKAEYDKKHEEIQVELESKDAELQENQEKIQHQEQLYEEKAQEFEKAESLLQEKKTELAGLRSQLEEAKASLEESRQELIRQNQALTSLPPQQQAIATEQYNTAYAEYLTQEQVILAQENELLTNETALIANETELNANLSEIEAAKGELLQAQTNFNQAAEKFQTSEEEVNQNLEEQQQAIDDAEERLDSEETKFDDFVSSFEEQKADAEAAIEELGENIKKLTNSVKKVSLPKYTIQTRFDQQGYSLYKENIDRLEGLGLIFPVFFFGVALLVTMTTITRMIEMQRIQIGTLKALGVSPVNIFSKYFYYALSSGLLGFIVGSIIGIYGLPNFMFYMYKPMYNFESLITTVKFEYVLQAFLITIIVTTLPVFLFYTSIFKESALKLMRPKVPLVGRKILIEKWTFLWSKFSFDTRLSLRNLFRYKLRALMVIVGIAGSIALLYTGFSANEAIRKIPDRQYQQLNQYQLTMQLNNAVDETDTEANHPYQSVLNYYGVNERLLVHQQVIEVGKSKESKKVTLVVPKNEKQLNEFILLRDHWNHDAIPLTNTGVIISEKLAKMFKLKVGSTIEFKTNDGSKKQAKVAAISENYMNNFIYFTSEYYQETMKQKPSFDVELLKLPLEFDQQLVSTTKETKASEDTVLIDAPFYSYSEKLDSSSDDETDASEDSTEATKEAELFKIVNRSGKDSTVQDNIVRNLLDLDEVSGITFISDAKQEVSSVLDSLTSIFYLLTVSAVVLTIVVLINLANINVFERRQDISVLKVMGYNGKKVTLYVFREIYLLMFVGIGLGGLIGIWLYNIVMAELELDFILFPESTFLLNFGNSSVVVILLFMLIMLRMHRTIQDINLLESLKSVE
ncbi:FtsX-like permease family protein [Carnobacterium gallinarum]|uniref:FtsX-like permease family protein n=1 Tax=Carnobacterium gallinarum TaxID=2749 RepID=UPI000554D9C3|nr:FtsX-like permease family protein [Carnobacterium gallinarum]